jgi:predicted amino acid-binding ACT domain protein
MKGELPVVGGRGPHVLKDKLAAFCQEIGQTESQVIRDVLSTYLGVNTPDAVQSLDKRVAALERKMTKLTQMI